MPGLEFSEVSDLPVQLELDELVVLGLPDGVFQFACIAVRVFVFHIGPAGFPIRICQRDLSPERTVLIKLRDAPGVVYDRVRFDPVQPCFYGLYDRENNKRDDCYDREAYDHEFFEPAARQGFFQDVDQIYQDLGHARSSLSNFFNLRAAKRRILFCRPS